jgi:hypothetical protein
MDGEKSSRIFCFEILRALSELVTWPVQSRPVQPFGWIFRAEQQHGIIMELTLLLLLGPIYTIQTNFMYFFAHDYNNPLMIIINPEPHAVPIEYRYIEY